MKHVYEIDQQAMEASLKNVIAELANELANETVVNKFYNRFVSAQTVAEIHGVHYMTVMAHIKAGNIPVQEGHIKNGQYQIRLSEALKLDFEKLRKRNR